LFLLVFFAIAQDSLHKLGVAMASLPADSIIQRPASLPGYFIKPDSGENMMVKQMLLHPFWKTKMAISEDIIQPYHKAENDWMFYLIAGLFLFLGLMRLIFPRFFSDLFKLFFNTTLKQMQVRERLLQSDLPSFLMNIFFIFSGGFYLYLLLNYYSGPSLGNHWLVQGLTTLMLMGIYMVKFVSLKFSGWVFGMEETTDLYIFIVGLMNKLLGIFLLPFAVLIAYSSGPVQSGLVKISLFLVAAVFFTRFIRSYSSLRQQLKISFFHFLLYLLAFELIPLLVIYKSLMLYFERSA
jgi:hypothetical protein